GGIEGGIPAAQAKASAVLSGLLSVRALNPRIRAANLGLPDLPVTGLPVGLAYQTMGKLSALSDNGSRYGLIQKWFDLFARLQTKDAQNAYGDDQEAFIASNIADGNTRWNVIANSVSNTSMIVDLGQDYSQVPAFANLSPPLQQVLVFLQQNTPLGTRITLNVDQWDGFPQRRQDLLRRYRSAGNVVIVAGDIHSSWVTDHSDASQGPLFEFTGPAISSSSFAQLIGNTLTSTAGTIGLPPDVVDGLSALLPELTAALNAFLVDRDPSSVFRQLAQDIRFVDTDRNGIVVVEASSDLFTTTYYLLQPADVRESYYNRRNAGLAKFKKRVFEIRHGRLTAPRSDPLIGEPPIRY
ncbi:MAG: hypothetical protein HC834_01195, partial [Rhodospirillales bacterium]|nr:hypothetical protein [Rhodospirillales bacterium]